MTEKQKKLQQLYIAKSSFYGNFAPTKEKLDKLNKIYDEAVEDIKNKQP